MNPRRFLGLIPAFEESTMTFRSLAASLLAVLALGLAFLVTAGAQSQDPAAPAPAKEDTKTEPVKTSDANSPTAAKTEKTKGKIEKATFASGCFWCGEAVFERIPGVKNVVSGYTGGAVPNPTYEEVSSGLTGHAEAFQIEFDPVVVSYDKLLKVFWISHDPTTPNQQGPDFGTQYRSAIFYHNEQQKTAAQKSFQEVTEKGRLFAPLVTQILPASTFYPAEAYHQNYYRKHPGAAYCQMFIVPKLKKLHLIK
jgi:peptide-methionine (S)-S-oxide reductase